MVWLANQAMDAARFIISAAGGLVIGAACAMGLEKLGIDEGVAWKCCISIFFILMVWVVKA